MFRKRTRMCADLQRMREAKERKRLEGPPLDYPPPLELPELRRQVIVIDYDFGRVEKRVDLYRTDRVDCYRVMIDGKLWRDRIGFSGVLEGIRKSFARVRSPN